MCNKNNKCGGRDLAIVNRGKWLRSLANIKVANKQAEMYVGRPCTCRPLALHIFCFMCIDYVHKTTFCILPGFVQGQSPKQPTKSYNKELARFHNHFSLTTNYDWLKESS